MVKARYFPGSNYAAMFDGQRAIRFEVDGPMRKPPYPEFYDIAINSLCYGGCDYCYVSASKAGRNFDNVIQKIHGYFGPMSDNERPFQVALGGHGEPTLHPDFVGVLEAFWRLGIVPNYTTNGMHLNQSVLEATERFAGGVAVSAHPHLQWERAIEMLADCIEVHLHVIISDAPSIDRFFSIHEGFSHLVDTFVLLPYQPVGRAPKVQTEFNYLLDRLEKEQLPNIAYGAYFYEEIKKRPKLHVDLYEPHMFSRYLILDDPIAEYRSSFDVS